VPGARQTMSPDKETLDQLRIDRRARPRNKPSFMLVLPLLMVIGSGVGSIWWFTQPKPALVRTAAVQETVSGGERTLLNASGYVTARREATVSSKVTGKVVEVLVEEGMAVEDGQILARIDSSNVEQSLHLAEAQLEAARKMMDETQASLDQSERDLKRTSAMANESVVTQSELENDQTEVRALKARLERQRADAAVSERELAVWKQQLDDTVIRAPFSGIVTSKDAQPGEMISPMSAGGAFTRTGICTIVDMGSLEIEVDVSESYINRVQAGQPVVATLDSYPNWLIPAKVIAIIPTADRQKATVKVRAGFEKLDPRILPDMSVKVAFQSAGETVPGRRTISLPKEAVRQDGGQDIVWVVRDGLTERRAVTIETTNNTEAIITAGVNAGDRVVVEGPANLVDGARVMEEKE
jgi:HlyD family secretion protein